MTGLASHPAAELFPLLDESSSVFIDLVADIRENGLVEAIELYEGKILDGRNRYRACQVADVEPRVVQWHGDNPVQYVISKNLHRRHLTDDQRAAVAAEAKPQVEAETERRRRVHQAATQSGHPVQVNSPAQRKQDRNETRNQLAKDFGVSPHKVRQATAIAKASPAVLKEVKEGTKKLSTAVKEVSRPRGRPRQTISESLLLPGQRVAVPPTRPAPSLDARITEAVDKGRGLEQVLGEIQSGALNLTAEHLRALIGRLENEVRARRKIISALKADLDRSKDT